MAPFNLLSLHMWLIINRLHQVRPGNMAAVGLDAASIPSSTQGVCRQCCVQGLQFLGSSTKCVVRAIVCTHPHNT